MVAGLFPGRCSILQDCVWCCSGSPGSDAMAPGFRAGTKVWYESADGRRRAEVEDYDAGSNQYRIDIRNCWVSASKVKIYEGSGGDERERKRPRTSGGDSNAVAGGDSNTGSVA